MNKFFQITFVIALIVLGIAACSTPQTQTQSQVTLATATPGETTSQSTQASTAKNTSSYDALPQSLAAVQAGEVYTFQVDPSQSIVEYAVNEVLLGNQQITRGSTNAVEGQFTLTVQDGKPVIAMSNLQVDLRTLTSDNQLRDAAIQRQWLESSKYPYAVFVAKQVEGLPADAVQGQSYTFKVSGDMTIREITKPVTFDVTMTVNGDTLTGEGSTQIYMKDFGFEPPEILGRFTVSDPATITIKGVANLVEG